MRINLALVVLAALFTLPLGARQDAQRPRPPGRDPRGLLKINQQYYDMSSATGGDFYFWAPGEFAAMAPIDIPDGNEDVVLAYGSLDDSLSVFEIPVETGARKLAVFCGIQRKDLVLIVRPDDSPARHGEPGVKIQSFQHMTIATVESPAPGVWRLELTGSGVYSISARLGAGRETPSLDSFEFVERAGRPGHEGLFPIRRVPGKGETLMVKVGLSRSVSKAELSFVAEDGSPIGQCAVELQDGQWLGTCTVPSRPFRVEVTGIDRGTGRFRRIEPDLITPE